MFCFRGVYYNFNCLTFGLSTASWVFTKIMKPVLKYLRTSGIICVLYLDDLLTISNSIKTGQEDCHIAKNILEYLGFLIKAVWFHLNNVSSWGLFLVQ